MAKFDASGASDPDIKEAEKRLERAKRDKDKHSARLDDYYKLVMPWRKLNDQERQDANLDDIFDNTAIDASADFAAEMLSTFTPVHFNWIDPVASITMSDADKEVLKPQIEDYNAKVFGEMRRSNFHAEALECYGDLGHGTMAMMIVDRGASYPIHCECLPANDLLLGRGAFKTVGVRAFDVYPFADQIPVLWPKAKDNADLMREIEKDPGKEWIVRQVLWQDHSDPGNEVWKYVAYAGKYKLEADTYKGDGACPLVVARWLTDATTSWGFGPGLLQLPNIKTANLLKELVLTNADFASDPVRTYDDDGVINVENGVSPGDWIPRSPGSKIDTLESASEFNVSYFTQDELRTEIKRGFYQDGPAQKGKTPPTAEQWLDEAAKAARRMGAPGGRLVVEWQYPIYKRFAYLLAKRGVLPKVELNGEVVVLNPSSPLIKSQKMEEALQVQRFAGVMNQILGPQLGPMIMDKGETTHFIADRMGINVKLIPSKTKINEISETFMAAQAASNAGIA